MQTLVSDTEIRAHVRSVLTHNQLDVQLLSIGSARGVVRISGEFRRSMASASPLRSSLLEDLERDLRRLAGVRRVHFEPVNWRKAHNGAWHPVASKAGDGQVHAQTVDAFLSKDAG